MLHKTCPPRNRLGLSGGKVERLREPLEFYVKEEDGPHIPELTADAVFEAYMAKSDWFSLEMERQADNMLPLEEYRKYNRMMLKLPDPQSEPEESPAVPLRPPWSPHETERLKRRKENSIPVAYQRRRNEGTGSWYRGYIPGSSRRGK